MQLIAGALALGLSSNSKLIVIAAAVVVVLAIVVVSIMVLRSDSGDSKGSRGLAFEVDEGPAGGAKAVSKQRDMSDGDWGAPPRTGGDAQHRPAEFGGTVGGRGTPSSPNPPMWENRGNPNWGDNNNGGQGQPPQQGSGWGQQQDAGWGQPERTPSRPNPQQPPAGPNSGGWGAPPAQPQQGNGWGDPAQPQQPAWGNGAPAPQQDDQWGAAPQRGGPPPQQPAWGPGGPAPQQDDQWGAAPQRGGPPPQQQGWGDPAQQQGWGNGGPPPQQPAWGPGGPPPQQDDQWGAPPQRGGPPPQQQGWGDPAQPGWRATPSQPQPPQQPAWGDPAQQPGWRGGPPPQQQPGWGGPPAQQDDQGWGPPPGRGGPAQGAPVGTRAESRVAYIIIREGKEPGRTYELRKDRLSIGRSRDSDIFLEDLAVSRLHASIYRDDQGSYILRDENSANGTTVNGQRVSEHRLNEGDEVQVGQTTMTFTRR